MMTRSEFNGARVKAEAENKKIRASLLAKAKKPTQAQMQKQLKKSHKAIRILLEQAKFYADLESWSKMPEDREDDFPSFTSTYSRIKHTDLELTCSDGNKDVGGKMARETLVSVAKLGFK